MTPSLKSWLATIAWSRYALSVSWPVSCVETDVRITTPDGVLRAFYELNIANGGRAIGPDGTEYVVQQVNQGPLLQQPGQPPDYYGRFGHRQVRIRLISPGSGENFFYTKDEDGKWTGICRG